MKNAEDLSGLTVEALWTGKSVGFIPRTVFHKDPSGNLNVEKEVLFFMDFKLSEPPRWWSIDERDDCIQVDDWTPSDTYERDHQIGRWWCLRYVSYERSPVENAEAVSRDLATSVPPQRVNPILVRYEALMAEALLRELEEKKQKLVQECHGS